MANYKRSLLTKERILESASRLFYEKGYTAATVREICAQSGISASRINYHFSSKADLAGLICSQFFSDFTNEIQGVIDDHCPHSPLTEAIALRYLVRVLIGDSNNSPFARFYQEISREGILSEVFAAFDPELYLMDLDHTQMQVKKPLPEFVEIHAGILGAALAAILHSWEGMLAKYDGDWERSLKAVQDILVELFLKQLNCRYSYLEEILELSYLYYSLIEVEIHSLTDVTLHLSSRADGSEKLRLQKLFEPVLSATEGVSHP